MKQLFEGLAVLSCSILFLAGCDQLAGLPEKPELSASVTELIFPMSGGEQTFSFETNRNWTASVDPSPVTADVSWCTISSAGGAGGENWITVSVEGMEGDYREAILILNASAAGAEIRVRQSGIPLLTTGEPAEIMESTALLTMTWQYSGEIEVSDFGFSLREGTSSSSVYYPLEAEPVPGTYTMTVQDLKPATEYHCASYVRTSDGKIYAGDEKAFTTAALPQTVGISEIKAMGRNVAVGGMATVSDNLLIEGVVIASYTAPSETVEPEVPEETKSLSVEEDKIVIVDGAEKDCGITLSLEAATNVYAVGDKVSVRVKDGVLSHVASDAVYLAPLSSGIVKMSEGNAVTPVTVSHTELKDYESMYVTIEDTQLMESFRDLATWSSASSVTFEVRDSEVSYDVYVPAGSEIGGQSPVFDSGSLRGIVVSDDVSGYMLAVDSEQDIAGLSEERFESMLNLTFLAPVFSGHLYVGEEITGSVVRVEYRNGDNSIIAGPVTVSVSGDASEGITVQSLSDITVAAGSGYIDFVVSGTPVVEGSVTFTVTGIDGLEETSCTAEVEQPYKPVVGNFDAWWDFSAHGYASSIACAGNTSADITVSDMTLVASEDNMSGSKWKDDWGAIGWDANVSGSEPVQYYWFTLTVASGKTLDLSGIDLSFRISGGDINLKVQYSVNAAAYKDAYETVLTGDSETSFVIGLVTLSDMAGISEGSTVTFRIVPSGTNASTKWGLKKGDRSFAIYGDTH